MLSPADNYVSHSVALRWGFHEELYRPLPLRFFTPTVQKNFHLTLTGRYSHAFQQTVNDVT